MFEVNVDLLGPQGGVGDIANYFSEQGKLDPGLKRPFLHKGRAYVQAYVGGDPSKPESYKVFRMHTNATLRRDEWKRLDDAVMMVARQRLGGAEDLRSRGLTYPLGNGLASTVLEWHDVSDALEAELTMDALTRGNNDRVKFQHNYLPLPIIHADYEINQRVLLNSRNMGAALDTTMAERAARKVAEKLEAMFFTNTSYTYGETDDRARNAIYSYINHPDRNAVTISTAWDDSGKSMSQLLNEVKTLKQTSINNLHYGPWQLYIPTAYETVLDGDYDATTPGTTVRERILKIDGIDSIRVVDMLPANNVLLVQMTTDVVRLVEGMPLQNIQWSEEGGMVNKFKVMTIQVPQIRSDQNGKTGIVHQTVT